MSLTVLLEYIDAVIQTVGWALKRIGQACALSVPTLAMPQYWVHEYGAVFIQAEQY